MHSVSKPKLHDGFFGFYLFQRAVAVVVHIMHSELMNITPRVYVMKIKRPNKPSFSYY